MDCHKDGDLCGYWSLDTDAAISSRKLAALEAVKKSLQQIGRDCRATQVPGV